MNANNSSANEERRTYTLELTRAQTPKLEIVSEKPESTGLALLLSTEQEVIDSAEKVEATIIEPNTNLFAAGHMVDPIAHLYDFALEEPEEGSALTLCCENASLEDATRFPESREIYLGLLGLLDRQRPNKDLPPNSECCEHDMAKWFLKRRLAYRPAWGGAQEKS